MSVDSGSASMAARLGIKPGMVVQELGWDEDADEDLRDAIIELSGGEMVDEDTDEVADVVLLWWREDDGDLFDALTDAITSLADDGVVWLLVPKSGRPGHVEPGDVTEVAPTAGLSQTSSVSAAPHTPVRRILAFSTIDFAILRSCDSSSCESSRPVKTTIGTSRRRQTSNSLRVWLSIPFAASITMTALSTAVSVR